MSARARQWQTARVSEAEKKIKLPRGKSTTRVPRVQLPIKSSRHAAPTLHGRRPFLHFTNTSGTPIQASPSPGSFLASLTTCLPCEPTNCFPSCPQSAGSISSGSHSHPTRAPPTPLSPEPQNKPSPHHHHHHCPYQSPSHNHRVVTTSPSSITGGSYCVSRVRYRSWRITLGFPFLDLFSPLLCSSRLLHYNLHQSPLQRKKKGRVPTPPIIKIQQRANASRKRVKALSSLHVHPLTISPSAHLTF